MITNTEIEQHFKNELYPLTNNENYDSTLNLLTRKLINPELTITGVPLSFNIIKNKWIEYCAWWNTEWKGTEERYIPKEKKKLVLYAFIINKMYNRNFVNRTNEKEYYLFGDHSKKELRQKLKKFEQTIK